MSKECINTLKPMSIVLYNLYKKTRQHPFLFTENYDPELDILMKELVRNDVVFITSAGDTGVFDVIIRNTRRNYKYILVGQEYIGCIFANHVIVRSIVIVENSFVDFESEGRIFVDFNIRIGRKNLRIRVAHFYNCGQSEQSDGADLMLRTSDPVL